MPGIPRTSTPPARLTVFPPPPPHRPHCAPPATKTISHSPFTPFLYSSLINRRFFFTPSFYFLIFFFTAHSRVSLGWKQWKMQIYYYQYFIVVFDDGGLSRKQFLKYLPHTFTVSFAATPYSTSSSSIFILFTDIPAIMQIFVSAANFLFLFFHRSTQTCAKLFFSCLAIEPLG